MNNLPTEIIRNIIYYTGESSKFIDSRFYEITLSCKFDVKPKKNRTLSIYFVDVSVLAEIDDYLYGPEEVLPTPNKHYNNLFLSLKKKPQSDQNNRKPLNKKYYQKTNPNRKYKKSKFIF